MIILQCLDLIEYKKDMCSLKQDSGGPILMADITCLLVSLGQ